MDQWKGKQGPMTKKKTVDYGLLVVDGLKRRGDSVERGEEVGGGLFKIKFIFS